jgi:hypothetical protein
LLRIHWSAKHGPGIRNAANVLKKHHVHEPLDPRFRAAARLLVSLWREEWGLPIGSHLGEDGKRRKLGSRISVTAGKAGGNFLLFDPACADGGLGSGLRNPRRATKSSILKLCWPVRDCTDTCLEDRLLAASLAAMPALILSKPAFCVRVPALLGCRAHLLRGWSDSASIINVLNIEVAMPNPAGESRGEVLMLEIDRRLMLQLRGPGGAERDDALERTTMSGEMVAAARIGRNGRHALCRAFLAVSISLSRGIRGRQRRRAPAA